MKRDRGQKQKCYLQGPLEGADGQQSQVLLLLCVPHQVHIYKLLKLQRTIQSNSNELKMNAKQAKKNQLCSVSEAGLY